eukprot:CAMPEP_0172454270 /NCGR_PEP_ID=MMETSP1065-20121228/11307_1 /TAXON_ID=265537 /ORGANISM="Amphiprora paludosa, Strain CCMP125" /LENGTH=493 /DNA_ID=CAMNT_0013206567 /DNA_START=317 /DNA_END=1798 /DNA_ORIENTATION=-
MSLPHEFPSSPKRHAHNHHTIVHHPWKSSSDGNSRSIDRLLGKTKRCRNGRGSSSLNGSDSSTILTESTGFSSQSSLFSRGSSSSRSPKSPYVRKIPHVPFPLGAAAHNQTNSSAPPTLPSTEFPILGTENRDQRGTISTLADNSTSNNSVQHRPIDVDSLEEYHRVPPPRSERGVFRSDTNDDLQKPLPPRSPGLFASPRSDVGSTLNRQASTARPASLNGRSRSTSSGSSSTASSIPGIPRPPQQVRSTSTPACVGIAAVNATKSMGPIDVDSVATWQEDNASVDSSLVMMNIEDPAEHHHHNPPIDSESTEHASVPSSKTSRHSIKSSSLLDVVAQEKWIQGWGTGSPQPPTPSEDTLALEESSFWHATDEDDDSNSSPCFDESTLSSNEPDYGDQTRATDEEGECEQDTAPLNSFMRLERVEELLAESDGEEDMVEIRKYFDRFPVLDERETERMLAGYVRGFEPNPPPQRRPVPRPPPVASSQVAFEI